MRNIIILFITVFTVGTAYSQKDTRQDLKRIEEVFKYIEAMYVDSVPSKEISEAAIVAMLEKLDPHSTYIPADEVAKANENINGSFVGVGIRFNILKDTLLVVSTIPSGPSEKVGVMAGDKIIEIDGENVAGIGLKNSDVRDRLLGDKDTKVLIKVLRGKNDFIKYTITRDNIPVNSVISYYMVDDVIGYIKLTSFSRTTPTEVREAIEDLKAQGMKDLIFDLQGNGGGLLSAAKDVSDEFLKDNKLIVYSEGRVQPKHELKANVKGNFEKGRLVILVDENSASASEIVSGAIQDWDRGALVGRRTFGKGLVQRPINLSDGSQIRLTISRYFTPSGRFIQKPYDDIEEYRKDYSNRFEHGEMMHQDSIHFADSLMYETLVTKRKVYGGGGVMPDIFVPLDTMEYSQFYIDLSRAGIINKFSIEFANKNRDDFKVKYNTVNDYINNFNLDQDFMDGFFDYALEEDEKLEFVAEDYEISGDLLKLRLKASIAQNIWDLGAFYQVFNVKNEIFMKGYQILKDKTYKKMKLSDK